MNAIVIFNAKSLRHRHCQHRIHIKPGLLAFIPQFHPTPPNPFLYFTMPRVKYMKTTVRKIVRGEIGVPTLNFQSGGKITYLDSMLLSTVDGSPPFSQVTLGAIVGIFTLRQIRSLPDQTDISLSDLMQTSEFAVFSTEHRHSHIFT